MLLSDDIEDWILNMENFILNTCHSPGRNQRFNFVCNDWLWDLFTINFLLENRQSKENTLADYR